MADKTERTPLFTFNYCDPETGIRGYLVVDSLVDGLAAGGLRVRPGVNPEELGKLARNMTLKQAAVGIQVGGAKAGIDMDPARPDKGDVIRRFLRTARPLLMNCYNCGPDLNTTMAELEGYAAQEDIPSLKLAVGRCRGLSDEEFLKRYALFAQSTDQGAVNTLRAPTAVRESVLGCLRALGVEPRNARVAIQGAGNMGGGTALLLNHLGVPVTAWADDEKCLVDDGGLDVPALLEGRKAGRLPALGESRPSAHILEADCDVLVLAAITDAISVDRVAGLRCRSMCVAANMGVNAEAERAAWEKGIKIVPDLVTSVGGSVAVEALYKANPTRPEDILEHVAARISKQVQRVFELSESMAMPPRQALIEDVRKRAPHLGV